MLIDLSTAQVVSNLHNDNDFTECCKIWRALRVNKRNEHLGVFVEPGKMKFPSTVLVCLCDDIIDPSNYKIV